ncbi:hypothetical protein Tdes44962_MAKER07649 [Teratosphaeria destructans]|uniref:Uncharacterized protein n=1 Tax=Teratosphaeria destructans TaxID=418781 RepID=A0A9W7W637_9PEZI|nr:hypothetical protein Tdes44962_MAKER07649 [Teratosphaeria destructans]
MHPSSAEITITPWTHPFAQPQFNGLRLTPYGGAGDFLLMPVPAHLSSTPATPRKAATSEKKASEVIRRSWLGLAGDRGSGRLNAFVRELGKLG